MRVQFSPQVKAAFADLAAAVDLSEHFDQDIRSIVRDWSQGKASSVKDVIQTLPAVAGETFRHIEATGDARAREAWEEVRSQMPEQGFSLVPTLVRGK